MGCGASQVAAAAPSIKVEPVRDPVPTSPERSQPVAAVDSCSSPNCKAAAIKAAAEITACKAKTAEVLKLLDAARVQEESARAQVQETRERSLRDLEELESEFAARYQDRVWPMRKKLGDVFALFDATGRGWLEEEDILMLATARRRGTGRDWDPSKNKQLMAKIDLDGDGKIGADEFIHYFMNRWHGGLCRLTDAAFGVQIAELAAVAQKRNELHSEALRGGTEPPTKVETNRSSQARIKPAVQPRRLQPLPPPPVLNHGSTTHQIQEYGKLYIDRLDRLVGLYHNNIPDSSKDVEVSPQFDQHAHYEYVVQGASQQMSQSETQHLQMQKIREGSTQKQQHVSNPARNARGSRKKADRSPLSNSRSPPSKRRSRNRVRTRNTSASVQICDKH